MIKRLALALALVSPPAAAAPSVVDLQPAAQTYAVTDDVRLVDLNPLQGRWFLLTAPGAKGVPSTLHIENPRPGSLNGSLSDATGLVFQTRSGPVRCAPWVGQPSELVAAAARPEAYVPVCNGRLWVRNTIKGHKTPLEWSADVVRDRLKAGEAVTEVLKGTIYKDRYLERVNVAEGGAAGQGGVGTPPSMRLRPEAVEATLAAPSLGIPLEGAPARLPAGQWVPTAGHPGVWVAAVAPSMVEIDAERGPKTQPDSVEAKALTLMVAFDLSKFDVAYELGTDHPRVGWSERIRSDQRIAGYAGPDGFDSILPLVRTGQVAPAEVPRLVATFTAGFKRGHGAFKSGPYAGRDHGSHYGFVQDGVVLSTMWPDLATFVVWRDGTVDIRTWTEADGARLPDVLHARQNGVSIVQMDENGVSRAGGLVDQWSGGNWSGSAEGQLRSLRASACVVKRGESRFLVYGWFTSATPAGMAHTLLAAGCEEAMLLDMNALEHTYLALYERSGGGLIPEHLDTGMSVLDKVLRNGTILPRFVAIPDNRDFFEILVKDVPKSPPPATP